MASRVLVAVDSLTRPELLQIADQLKEDRYELRIELANVQGRKIAQDVAFRKNIKRLIFYGALTLIGIFFSPDEESNWTGENSYLHDVPTLLALAGLALMVWEALGFAAEVSESHRLEDEFESLAGHAALVERELAIIAGELERRENASPQI